MVSPRRLAEEAVFVERVLIPENVGYQDQYAAAFGGLNYISFRDRDEARVEKLFAHRSLSGYCRITCCFFYTGIQRYSDSIQQKHVSGINENLKSLEALSDLALRGRDCLRGPLKDLDMFGRLLGEGWKLKKNIGSGVTNPEIDNMYNRAIDAGALGGKLLGAGGGGFPSSLRGAGPTELS